MENQKPPLDEVNPKNLKEMDQDQKQSRSTGLPKQAVEKLRTWFDNHFDYPYPNEKEKSNLSTETGLTITQINNWFVNARVRIWKPQMEKKKEENPTAPHNFRGNLPKVSVEILKKWLYDHFNHPYPTDGQKDELANASGLSLTQVNNWFINARRRIWKPHQGKEQLKPEVKIEDEVKNEIKEEIKTEDKEEVYSERMDEIIEEKEEIKETDNLEEFEESDVDIHYLEEENEYLRNELNEISYNYERALNEYKEKNSRIIERLLEIDKLRLELNQKNMEMSKKLISRNKTEIKPSQGFQPFKKSKFEKFFQ